VLSYRFACFVSRRLNGTSKLLKWVLIPFGPRFLCPFTCSAVEAGLGVALQKPHYPETTEIFLCHGCYSWGWRRDAITTGPAQEEDAFAMVPAHHCIVLAIRRAIDVSSDISFCSSGRISKQMTVLLGRHVDSVFVADPWTGRYQWWWEQGWVLCWDSGP